MITEIANNKRIVAGMCPSQTLSVAHYEAVLKPWVSLQHSHDCYFYVADWNALTRLDVTEPQLDRVHADIWEMLIGWLAVGLNPGTVTFFLQSKVPEQAELFTILSMFTPITWLERQPNYKESQAVLKQQDLLNFGFLGMPLLQAVALLTLKASHTIVIEDQVPSVELAREIARRFNYVFGRDVGYAEKAEVAMLQLGKKQAKLYQKLCKRYQERGDHDALQTARALIQDQVSMSLGDKERLLGYIEGGGKCILLEPEVLLAEQVLKPTTTISPTATFQSKIFLSDSSNEVAEKIRTMPTDPARVRRSDKGDPNKCPVWDLHKYYADSQQRQWVFEGCTSAKIGCLDCKQPLIDKIEQDIAPIREKIQAYRQDTALVRGIVADHCDKVREVAKDTLEEVRDAMAIEYW